MIEIELLKLRGTHTAPVKVNRGGKTFYQNRRVGRKEVDEFDDFKSELKDLDNDELKDVINQIISKDPDIAESLNGWYHGHAKSVFDSELTSIFGMKEDGSRDYKDPDWLYTETIEGFKKIYLVTQEYLSRIESGGLMWASRGLGSKIYEKFKDLEPGEDINIKQYNVSSWTTDYDVSEWFSDGSDGGIIIEMNVSTERVFIHPDCAPEIADDYDEREAIIMGSNIEAVISQVYEPE